MIFTTNSSTFPFTNVNKVFDTSIAFTISFISMMMGLMMMMMMNDYDDWGKTFYLWLAFNYDSVDGMNGMAENVLQY